MAAMAVIGHPIETILVYFLSTSHLDTNNEVLSQLAFWLWKKKLDIAFQEGSHGDHIVFLIRTILSIFDLQVT